MLACAMSLNKPQGDKDGLGVLFVGGCARVERINTILAIPLNDIATVLVATSNYVMQCLSVSSRKEVDEAHAAGSYLNIGIPSVHNLLQKPSWNSFLWPALVLTTVLNHLLFNSAFFGALQANNYGVAVVDSRWGTEEGTGLDHAYVRVNMTDDFDAGALPLADTFAAQMWDSAQTMDYLS